MSIPIGIAGVGTYFPKHIETATDLAPLMDIPEHVLREKMGIKQRHVAGPEDTITYMATQAACNAIESAGISPEQIKLIISHGSQHKDHLVWNSAGKIQDNIGAVNAYAFELYAVCAAAPIALHAARGMMLADSRLDYVLLTAASRENELINFKNQRTRFMFNFGAGAGAFILQRGSRRNQIMGMSALTDGSLSETVYLTMDAVGDTGREYTGDLRGLLDVRNGEYMAERLGAVSLQNFVKVIREAVDESGASLSDIAFLGITHMKRSFYHQILDEIGLTPEQSVYLEDYGHVQSADQAIALELGLQQGKIRDGDLIVLAGAGTGYTWSAIAVRWGES